MDGDPGAYAALIANDDVPYTVPTSDPLIVDVVMFEADNDVNHNCDSV